MDTPLVYVVITNWNGLDDTVECAESVLNSSYPHVRTVLVDNGSTDGSAEALRERFASVPLLRTGHNGPVTAAYNAGIRFAVEHGADYVLMLNNDTTVHPEMIAHLVRAAEEDPVRGILTPKIYFYDRPDVIWFAGASRHRWDFGAYDTKRGEYDGPGNEETRAVDYAWACGFLLKRALLDEIGFFDTRFWLYYDDVDICVRAQQAGYRIWYVPEARMWHKVGASTGSERFARTWATSKMLFFRKHTHGLHRWALTLYVFAHAFYGTIVAPSNRRMKGYIAPFLQGLWAGLQWKEQDGRGI